MAVNKFEREIFVEFDYRSADESEWNMTNLNTDFCRLTKLNSENTKGEGQWRNESKTL